MTPRPARRVVSQGALLLVTLAAASVPAEAGRQGERREAGARQTPQTLLARANAVYASQRWSEAERLYRGVLEAAPASTSARHGLGNALYRQGRRGAALAQWIGALRRDPGDAAVRRNVALVRAELAAAAGAFDADAIAAPPQTVLDRLSPAAVAWILAAALDAAAVAFAVALLVRRARVVATVTLVLILVAAAALAAATAIAWAGRPGAVVAAVQGRARASPSETAAVALALPEGTALRPGEARGAWTFVSLPNGLSGWLPADEVAVIP